MAKFGELQVSRFTLTLVCKDRVGRTRTKRAIQTRLFYSNKFRVEFRGVYAQGGVPHSAKLALGPSWRLYGSILKYA